MKSYLIVGNGVAGVTAAETIRSLDPEGDILILAQENEPFYYRVRLPDFIAGAVPREALNVRSEAWYASRRITTILGCRAVSGDAEARTVVTDDGRTLSYDRLLLATGSRSFVPPIDGAARPGVFTLRSLSDARAIAGAATSLSSEDRRAVLIGGGVLGLEAGHALQRLGLSVTVVEVFPRLLPRQLDTEGASVLQDILEEKGFVFHLGAQTKTIQGQEPGGHVREVVLADGQVLPASLLLVSAGVRPDLALAKSLGLTLARGVVVDDQMRASLPGIFAAGDVAEASGVLYGTWTAATEQGRAAGTNMAGGNAPYKGSLMSNTLKVAGVSVSSAGEIDAEGTRDAIVRHEGRVYRKLVFSPAGDNRIIGCIMVGDTSGFLALSRLMAEGRPAPDNREDLLDPAFDYRALS